MPLIIPGSDNRDGAIRILRSEGRARRAGRNTGFTPEMDRNQTFRFRTTLHAGQMNGNRMFRSVSTSVGQAIHAGINSGSMPGLSDDNLSQIPSVQIGKKHAEDMAQCSICLVNFEEDETVRQLPCKHYFHTDCIYTWLRQNNTCPVCRGVVIRKNCRPYGWCRT